MSRLSIGERLQKSWRWAKGERSRTLQLKRGRPCLHAARTGYSWAYASKRRKTLASSTERAARNHARLIEAVKSARLGRASARAKHESMIGPRARFASYTRKLFLMRDAAWRFRERRDMDLERWDRKIRNLKIELDRAAAHL